MTCQIKIEDGNIVDVLTENGDSSKLYKDIRAENIDVDVSLVEYDRIVDVPVAVDSNGEPMYQLAKQFENKQVFEIAKRYNGDVNGFFNKAISPSKLRSEVGLFGYEVKTAVNGSFYLSKNGKKVNMFKQISSNKEAWNAELESKLRKVIEGLGLKVDWKENSRFKNISATGVADLLERAIYLAKNRHIDTLPEEVAHFYVEMLRSSGNPLYKSMMNDIVKFQIYKDVKEEYKDDYDTEEQFREEAIGKAIAKFVVANFKGEQTQLEEVKRTRSWFNKVLNWFENTMRKLGFSEPLQVVNYFDIANTILEGNVQEVSSGTGVRFQKKATNPFNDKLLTNNERIRTVIATSDVTFNKKLIKKGDSYKEILENGVWRFVKRVSDVLTEKKLGFTGNSDPEISKNKAIFGTKVHSDVSELVKEETGQVEIDDTRGESGFKRELRTLVKNLIAEHPDSDFYTELNVLKTKDGRGNKSELAGTIDLLVVDKEGRAHLYDFKTINDLQNKYIDGRSYKEKWFEQLSQYKAILSSEYGIKKFGQTRIIPMDVQYSDDLATVAVSLEFGNNKIIRDESKANLNPVPRLDETTDIDSVDRFLNAMRDRIANLEGSTISNRKQLIKEIEESITKVLITKDVNDADAVIVSDSIIYNKILEKIEKEEPLTVEDCTKIIGIQSFYINAFEKGWVTEGGVIFGLSSDIQTNFQAVKSAIDNTLNSSSVKQDYVIKPTSNADKANQLSNIDVPAFRAFKKLLDQTWSRIQMQMRVKKESIGELIEQIKKETGKSDDSMFDSILSVDQNGKRDGKLIAKRNKEWFEFHEENLNELFKTIEDSPLAISYIKGTKLGKQIENYAEFEKELKKRISDWAELHPDADNKYAKKFVNSQIRGMLHKYSDKFKISEEFQTDAYKKLMKKPDSPLAQLYNRFLEVNRLASDNCDNNIIGTSLPYVRKHSLRMILESPIDLRRNRENLLDDMQTENWQTSKTDSDGNRIYNIPLKYNVAIGDRNLDQQSYDLGQVLMQWEETVNTNIELQKIENLTKLFQYALKQNRELIVVNGIVQKKNGNFDDKEISNHTLEQFQDYMVKYLYGQNMKDDDVTLFGVNQNKLATGIMRYYSSKSLFLNVFSSLANLTGGMVNIFGTAIRSGKFDYKDIAKSIAKLSTFDSDTWSLVNLFDITGEEFRQKDLSVDWINKNVVFDKVYILQKIGDNAVQYTTLISYLQNIKLNKKEDGTISFDKAENKADSVANKVRVEGDKISIEGLDLNNEQHALEFFMLREKIRLLVSETIGTTSENDQFLYGNTLKSALLLQFRRWILPMYNARAGRLKYNGVTGEYQQGKYRSSLTVLKQIITKDGFKLIKELTDLKNSTVIDKVLRDKFELAKELHPDLDFDQFKQMHFRDLRSAMVDVVLLCGIVVLRHGLKDDDEDESSTKKVLMRALARTSSELGFWLDPESFTSIIKTPIPIIGLASDLMNIIKSLGVGFFDELVGEDSEKQFKSAGKSAIKLTIGANTWHSFIKEIESNE